MKDPDQCANIHEVREEIDIIDREVIDALSKRFQYVIAAARFKTSEASVRAPDRFQAMLQQRREWALESGLNPDVVEKLYRDLVNHFIEEELKRYKSDSVDS
ncbi:MAG: isochorismate lyase [Microcoleus sp. PH2017_29_MFU_D_A]|uniref:isochorismate lyase n=1 Tax=unclassified Microcoleus TaxID=2642155 RepID=UPI001D447E6C|nr:MULTISPECIES: isochorismate lyase [unclassified Microcoleus]MCC3421568.1 isochorismate lyase [Microcoleus sp. PH2017_07_MST_O_A]MCC3440805.1 isochorismate lyase [Microcoleus sp. PH2017_03_ELD_O_A]MCC3464962.1 isochorismate lyase [Microcoleus sp. PH2017_06_SFM_O_A]MCC3504440.1 isochorismate lyase [Microcoleus sp. PH2017_19_SFW_U_A]TAE13421.1 MAG: isochorismate lyase [Oscillatoriales cyanobacterium]